MPGVGLRTSARDGRVVVALRGDLDVTVRADAEAAITALVARGQYLIIDMSALDFLDCSALGALLRVRGLARRAGGDVVLAAPGAACTAAIGPDRQRWGVLGSGQRGGRRCGYRQPPEAALLAAACGGHCTPWEGSAIAYWYRVIAAGAAAALEDSLHGRARR
jgi:anti-sigma B factor antagonist